jgi:undecaprenyl-diphosphatase
MNILTAIFFGLVQGLTEFIPVSSSGHLLLMHRVFGTGGNELAFDVALHIGTLVALITYFYNDLWQLFLGILGKNKQQRLAWLLVLATIPAVLAGVLLESVAETTFRSAGLVATTMLIAGLLMFLAEYVSKRYKKKQDLKNVTKTEAIAIGVAQAAALVPGISRSGATITTGLFVGMDRVSATRFSFL